MQLFVFIIINWYTISDWQTTWSARQWRLFSVAWQLFAGGNKTDVLCRAHELFWMEGGGGGGGGGGGVVVNNMSVVCSVGIGRILWFKLRVVPRVEWVLTWCPFVHHWTRSAERGVTAIVTVLVIILSFRALPWMKYIYIYIPWLLIFVDVIPGVFSSSFFLSFFPFFYRKEVFSPCCYNIICPVLGLSPMVCLFLTANSFIIKFSSFLLNSATHSDIDLTVFGFIVIIIFARLWKFGGRREEGGGGGGGRDHSVIPMYIIRGGVPQTQKLRPPHPPHPPPLRLLTGFLLPGFCIHDFIQLSFSSKLSWSFKVECAMNIESECDSW